jgi:uncharacterized protein YaaN involved in tellurite resistance
MNGNQNGVLGMNRNAFTNYIVSEVSNHPAFDEAIGQNMNLRNKLIAFGNKRPTSMTAFSNDLQNMIEHLRRVKASGKAYVRGSDIKDLVYLRKLIMAYKNTSPVVTKKKKTVGSFFKSLFSKKK